jgi:hypothetical protein
MVLSAQQTGCKGQAPVILGGLRSKGRETGQASVDTETLPE